MRIAALVPSIFGASPGQRARAELWASYLRREHGWTVDFYPFEDEELHHVLYESGHTATKLRSMVRCYRRQLDRAIRLGTYDAILIYREAALVGPAVIERLAARSGAAVIYDLDDPTFVPYRSPTSGWLTLLKFGGKTRSLFRMADEVICINKLMANVAARYNQHVTVVPNVIDPERYRPLAKPSAGRPTVVWSGSHSTVVNVRPIAPALRRLQATRDVSLRIVCDSDVEIPGVQRELRWFSPERQVSDLQDCHIGVVPLADIAWNRWKFFFKAVQYMSVGLPVVAQRMGSNPEVIEDGVTGFLVESQDEWYERMKALVDDPHLRERMGRAGRAVAVSKFSADVHLPRVASLFDAALRRKRLAVPR
jgi:glycosyltransferase involved in cell wall biosynthesis